MVKDAKMAIDGSSSIRYIFPNAGAAQTAEATVTGGIKVGTPQMNDNSLPVPLHQTV